MMGAWCFCFEMEQKLKFEIIIAALLEKSGRAAFLSSLFLSKTHLILLSPNDTPQKTPPIVCFLKKRRAIVCTLAHESKKSCTRFSGCMILTLYHQRYDCGGGEACSIITTYLQPFKMGKVRNCVDFLHFLLNQFNLVTKLMRYTLLSCKLRIKMI